MHDAAESPREARSGTDQPETTSAAGIPSVMVRYMGVMVTVWTCTDVDNPVEVSEANDMAAYKITIWCEVPDDLPEPDLASALEQGELWEVADSVQYQLDQVTTDVV